MIRAIRLLAGAIVRLVCTLRRLLLENLALRQQLTVLKRKHPHPRITAFDRLFWILARRLWSGWKGSLVMVTPETVVRWHRAGFHLYWRLISRVKKRAGRSRISNQVRDLIFRMVSENSTWGAPRIHGELLMLGFDVSERSISRWMRKAPRDPKLAKRWLAFLRNHREAIVAMDFFTRHNHYVRDALLLLRYWPRSTAYLALSCDTAPNQPLDCSVVERRLS